MHVHAFSTYISAGMLNHIQGQVLLMSQLTAQLRSQSLRHYAPLQLHDNITALTSSLLYKKLSDITEHAWETGA